MRSKDLLHDNSNKFIHIKPKTNQSQTMNLLSIGLHQKIGLLFSWAALSPEEYDAKYRQQVEQLYAQNPKPFNQWFGGKDRLVIPFNRTEKKTEAPASIVALFSKYGYEITDYEKGYCLNTQYNREERISTAFQKIKKKILAQPAGDPDFSEAKLEGLYKQFMHDSQRTSVFAGDLVIVFSQNPHDVFHMSTNKNWTSCMEAERGQCWKELFPEIKEGGFVAYLVRKQDVNNLDRALSRVWIRALETQDGKLWAAPETSSTYGNAPEGFIDQIQNWVNKHQPVLPIGQYRRRGSLHSDTYSGGKDADKDIVFYIPKNLHDLLLYDWGNVDEVVPVVNQILQAYDQTANPSDNFEDMISLIVRNSFRMFNTYIATCADLARTCPWKLAKHEFNRFDLNQLIYISNNLSAGYSQRKEISQTIGIENIANALLKKLLMPDSYSQDEVVAFFGMITEPLIRSQILDEIKSMARSNPKYFPLYSVLKKAPAQTMASGWSIKKLSDTTKLQLRNIFSSQL